MITITVDKEKYLTYLKEEYEKVTKKLYDYERTDEVKSGMSSLPYHRPSSIKYMEELSEINDIIKFVEMCVTNRIQVSK